MTRKHFNKFVCLSDITHDIEEMDYVIYNPSKHSDDFGKKILHKTINDRFNIKLTEEQINGLFKYDENHLDGFIYELSEIIKNN